MILNLNSSGFFYHPDSHFSNHDVRYTKHLCVHNFL
uniref:Uncharacterized protein n=1 Tax=Arundo donax TaxID=35708 RepID=A0A0A8ZPL6_ARUDO